MLLKRQRIRAHFQKFVSLIMLAMLLNSCSIHLVPQYNADLEQQIKDGAKLSDRLYLQMIVAAPDAKSFSLYEDKYLNVQVEINSILFQDEIRPKANDIVASVQKLRDYFTKAMEDHRSKKTLSNGELTIYHEQLQAFWRPVLIEEIALKKVK
ncbi:MAG: hypothetical protein M3139_01125 [Bacteroidota bacterium]|nr:hypothetical protein [Bacteroidota bacterium]